MLFTERHNYIKSRFDSSLPYNYLPDTNVDIHFCNFNSINNLSTPEKYGLAEMRRSIPGAVNDEQINENNQFKYPVFMPRNSTPGRKIILLLHGLNERRWDKYLSWGHYLAENTGKPVLIFPISFHINRSVPEWLDPRLMTKKIGESQNIFHTKNDLTTFINYALSDRLTQLPERFLFSGLQTANDLVSLLSEINAGNHPLFEKETKADLFAYSIGGLLAQVMYVANPLDLFADSKLFLFCAGSVFSEMNGISKVIMDKTAHERVQYYYRNELEENIKKSGAFTTFFNNSKIGMAFRSMIAPEKHRNIRENAFRKSRNKIYAISFKKDKVIPPGSISETLMGTKNRVPENMEVFDFRFPYSHEVPFPEKNEGTKDLVNEAFETVFSKASGFLC